MTNGNTTLVQDDNYFAGNPDGRGRVRVAVHNLDNDSKADIVTGSGTNVGSTVTAFHGANTTPLGGTPRSRSKCSRDSTAASLLDSTALEVVVSKGET